MATAFESKHRPKAKKPRASTPAEIPSYQIIGQSLSGCLLSAVNATQRDVPTILRSLGNRPPPSPPQSRAISEFSLSSSTLEIMTDEPRIEPKPKRRTKAKSTFEACTYTLQDFSALDTLETLLMQYGTASHMGVRDPSYSFFINATRDAALYYKVLNKVAVITGDPLCCRTQYTQVLDDFRAFCKAQHWRVAIMAASDALASLAHQHDWISVRFGVAKAVNPLTNPLVLGTGGKRTVAKCKQLLKAGLSVQLYSPSHQNEPELEAELVRIYDAWRATRNDTRGARQAFMTVFDILALPRLMTFLYVTDAARRVLGFAALRKLGDGFHVDPYVATADAPRGTTDLLLFSAMAFCKTVGISHLSLGFEPQSSLGPADITGMPEYLCKMTRSFHRRMWASLPLQGKRAFHQRFHTDDEQDAGLHIVFFERPGIRHMLATLHFANISLRSVMGRNFGKASPQGSGETLRTSEESACSTEELGCR